MIGEKARLALWIARRRNPALPINPHQLAAAIAVIRAGSRAAAKAAIDESSGAALEISREMIPASLRIGSGRPSAVDRGGRLLAAARDYMDALAHPPEPWQLAAMCELHRWEALMADAALALEYAGGYYAASYWSDLADRASKWDAARAAEAESAPSAAEAESAPSAAEAESAPSAAELEK